MPARRLGIAAGLAAASLLGVAAVSQAQEGEEGGLASSRPGGDPVADVADGGTIGEVKASLREQFMQEVATCMEAGGFTFYDPASGDPPPELGDGEDAYNEALVGSDANPGCLAQAQSTQLDAAAALDAALNAETGSGSTRLEAAAATEGQMDALAAWTGCMQDAGYTFNDPDAVSAAAAAMLDAAPNPGPTPSTTEGQELSDEEIAARQATIEQQEQLREMQQEHDAMLTTSSDCSESSGLAAARAAAIERVLNEIRTTDPQTWAAITGGES